MWTNALMTVNASFEETIPYEKYLPKCKLLEGSEDRLIKTNLIFNVPLPAKAILITPKVNTLISAKKPKI